MEQDHHFCEDSPNVAIVPTICFENDHNTNNVDSSNVNIYTINKKTSSLSAFINFIKGNTGTGILSIPIGFKYTGLWVGMFFIILCGILTTYSMHILSRVSESVMKKHNLNILEMDYSDTIYAVIKFGPKCLQKHKGKFKHFTNFALILSQVAFCSVYLLFISQNIEYFINVVEPGQATNIYLIGFISTLCLILLCQIRNMRIFAHLSALAILATIVGLILVFIYLFTTGLKDTNSLPSYNSFRSTLIGFGIFAFAFKGISLCLPIRNRMIYPNDFTATTGVLNTVMVIVICICALMGFFGYARFGQNTLGSITYNIPNKPMANLFVKPLFIIAISISYPLQFYIPASIFAHLMLKCRFYREASDSHQAMFRRIMRVAVILLTYIIAMAVPHLDLMVSLIGAICCSFLGFIIPPTLELIHLWHERETIPNFWLNVLLKHLLFVVFGICTMIGGTISTTIKIIQISSH